MRAMKSLCIALRGLLALAAFLCAALLASCDLSFARQGSDLGIAEKARSTYLSMVSSSLSDAASVATDLATSEEGVQAFCKRPDADNYEAGVSQLVGQQRDAAAGYQKRLSDDRRVVKAALGSKGVLSDDATHQLERADAAIGMMDEILSYEIELANAVGAFDESLANPDMSQIEAYYGENWKVYLALGEITAPACMSSTHRRFSYLYETLGTYSYQTHLAAAASPLDERTLAQMVLWGKAREHDALDSLSWTAMRCYDYAADVLLSPSEEAPLRVDYRVAERVQPNMYPSMDSLVDVLVCSCAPDEIVFQVEVSGFTQQLNSKQPIAVGANCFSFKPELLEGLSAQDLELGRSTQLNLSLYDSSGSMVEQQSAPIEVLSLYDFFWETPVDSVSSAYALLAWLRPSQERIDSINRAAAGYMGQWTDGQFPELAGYQYGQDAYSTLLQVAAIMKAYSDTGVVYVSDTYSSSSDQRVLTPAQSIDRKQALCVETSVIIASCLLSAGMHPVIVITPGHAQVAVETWNGSNNYVLIETSFLPYGGIDRNHAMESVEFWGGLVPSYEDSGGWYSWIDALPDVWGRYFSQIGDAGMPLDGVFVVDCNLQRVLGYSGIETL